MEKLSDESRLDSSAIKENIDDIQKQASLLDDQIKNISEKNIQKLEEKKKQNESLISLESKLNETDLEIESVQQSLERTKRLEDISKTISRIEVLFNRLNILFLFRF